MNDSCLSHKYSAMLNDALDVIFTSRHRHGDDVYGDLPDGPYPDHHYGNPENMELPRLRSVRTGHSVPQNESMLMRQIENEAMLMRTTQKEAMEKRERPARGVARLTVYIRNVLSSLCLCLGVSHWQSASVTLITYAHILLMSG